MKKIFNVLLVFAAASLLFSACEPAGVGVAFPKEPRIEFESEGYTAVVGAISSQVSFTLRWMNEPTAAYTVWLASTDSDQVKELTGSTKVVENDVREMKIIQSDLVDYAAQLGYTVTSSGVTAPEGVGRVKSVSFRIYVAATDKDGNEFTQPATYTRYASVTLIPQAYAE